MDQEAREAALKAAREKQLQKRRSMPGMVQPGGLADTRRTPSKPSQKQGASASDEETLHQQMAQVVVEEPTLKTRTFAIPPLKTSVAERKLSQTSDDGLYGGMQYRSPTGTTPDPFDYDASRARLEERAKASVERRRSDFGMIRSTREETPTRRSAGAMPVAATPTITSPSTATKTRKDETVVTQTPDHKKKDPASTQSLIGKSGGYSRHNLT